MRKIFEIFVGILLVALVASSCETNSDRLVFPGEHQLNSPGDTIYSMVGLFAKLNKIADRYVLLGELRGDLMDVSENARC